MSPNFNLSEESKAPHGRLDLRIYHDGVLVEEWGQNLIVDASKAVLASLIGGAVSGNSISQISFGTNGAAAAAGNTSITNGFTKGVDTVTYPAPGQVSFTFSLGTTEANGKAISEFGLLTTAGTLFARKVRSSPLNKDTDISLSGTWTITF